MREAKREIEEKSSLPLDGIVEDRPSAVGQVRKSTPIGTICERERSVWRWTELELELEEKEEEGGGEGPEESEWVAGNALLAPFRALDRPTSEDDDDLGV